MKIPSRDDLRDFRGRARATLSLLWQAAPLWTVLWLSLLAVQGVLPAAIVWLTKWTIDAMNVAIGAGRSWETVQTVAVPVVLMGGVFLLQRMLGGLVQWVSVAQSEYVDDYVTNLIHEKAATVDYEFYEASDYHDLMEQAQSQGTSRVLQLIQNGGSLLQTSVTLLSIGAILVAYSLWIPLALIVSAVPILAVVLYYNRVHHTWWKSATPRRRRTQYYGLLLTTMQAAAEVRMNRLDRPLIEGYRDLRKDLRSERLVLVRNQAFGRFGAALASLLVTGAVMGWIVWEAFAGNATLGDLAAFYQAFTQAQSVTGTALTSAGAVYSNSLFLRHLFDFLDLEPRVVDAPDPKSYPKDLREGVRFEDVTFTYPGTERPALESFSLEIPAGKTVAIVGENGAGKSTFIKLLCRFYDPDSGRITVDGTDLREFSIASVRRRIAVMFQFSMKYQMTAEQNVRLGDPDAEPNAARLREAVVGAGADGLFDRLPNQEKTLLGRWVRRRRRALGRGVAARLVGPGVLPGEPARHPRRAHELHGLLGRERVARPVRPRGRGPDGAHHHPPVHDRPACGHHPRHERGAHRRVGHARGARGPGRPVRQVVGRPDAAARRRRRRLRRRRLRGAPDLSRGSNLGVPRA